MNNLNDVPPHIQSALLTCIGRFRAARGDKIEALAASACRIAGHAKEGENLDLIASMLSSEAALAGLDVEEADRVIREGFAIGKPPIKANGVRHVDSPEFSDDWLARRFTEAHCADLRYVAGWGKWMEWDGARWRPETTLRAYDLARLVCRKAAVSCEKGAARIASAGKVAAVEHLARADRHHAATVDQWDVDQSLLNTPGGTVDTLTGKVRPHSRSDYITKITAVAPSDADYPLWRAFLDKITRGDNELQRFIQRMYAYMLTGSTSLHALFFGFGTGANGKSVFLNTLTGILGDYATTAPMETFIASGGDRHPTELAGLRGARLVTAVETEEGRRWAEARIKTLTGGDKIAARFMRQDFFEFTPQFKLLIVGNHKPSLRAVDEAIRRRFHLIPFTVTIPPEERDPNLAEKLRAEWPAILRWGIEGCAELQKIGLAPPEAVRVATANYLAAEDALTEWMTDCCISKPDYKTESSTLFKSWSLWAVAAGEEVGSQKRFSQKLEDRGYEKTRMSSGRFGFKGISVIPNDPPAPSYGGD
jgi:putative DNA primase/helicase